MIIEWREINSVNVQELDEQHKKLIVIINKFFAIEPADEAGMLVVIKELETYAEVHFKTEEEYFVKFNYEKAAEHLKLHQAYREKIISFRQQLAAQEDKYQIFSGLLEFLQEWWIGHINGADQEYTKCFNQQGLF